MTVLFPPSMSPLCDFCITLFTSNTHCSYETSPFWVESPLNMLNFVILPTNWEATQGQEILCCGPGICLYKCVFFLLLTWFLLSPPNIINPPLTPCGNITSNIYTVTQPYLHWLQCITYFVNVFSFWEDQQSVLFIRLLYYQGLYSCMHIDKPCNYVSICECWGQFFSPQ